jgi:hypothetical protein
LKEREGWIKISNVEKIIQDARERGTPYIPNTAWAFLNAGSGCSSFFHTYGTPKTSVVPN